jgi:hypothetical protein
MYKITNLQIDGEVKYLSCKVELNQQHEFIMCGEVKNGQLNIDTVNCVYYQYFEWDQLPEETQIGIRRIAFEQMKKLV